MFTTPKSKSTLQLAIDNSLHQMLNEPVGSDEYAIALERVAKLHRMKEAEKPSKVDPNTLIMAGTNLLGILLILRYERVDIVTSKALGFVSKIR